MHSGYPGGGGGGEEGFLQRNLHFLTEDPRVISSSGFRHGPVDPGVVVGL